jgi:hypothetical protein
VQKDSPEVLYEPGKHSEHNVEPTPEKKPDGQFTQLVAPSIGWWVPAWHNLQSPFSKNEPEKQIGRHTVAPEFEVHPSAQLKQLDEPMLG